MDRPLLLSIQPRHARAIIEGRKTIEVRRRRVSAPSGTTVILYATAPVKAVVATARLTHSFMSSPDATWDRFSAVLGIARDELDTYLDGGDGCLLFLSDVLPLDVPLPLEELRRAQPFQPPQSYRFVSHRDPGELHRLPARPATASQLSGVQSLNVSGSTTPNRTRKPHLDIRSGAEGSPVGRGERLCAETKYQPVISATNVPSGHHIGR